jgi:hypothetical protein
MGGNEFLVDLTGEIEKFGERLEELRNVRMRYHKLETELQYAYMYERLNLYRLCNS